MIPRERFLLLLEHREPDRIPLDVWISPAFSVRLQRELSPGALAKFEPDLWYGLRGIGPDVPDEFKKRGIVYNPFIHYGVGVQIDPNTIEDEWGIRRSLTATRTESRITFHPLRDADVDSLDDYLFPDPYASGRFTTTKAFVDDLKEKYLVSGGFGMDTFWCQSWYLRGFQQMMVDLHSNPEFVKKLMGELLVYYVGIGKQLAELGVDLVQMADDVAMQTGLIISPNLWRKYIKPCYKALIEVLKPKVKYIYYHSDGDLRAIIPDLIEIGVNVLNPLQPDCMNLAELKSLYGKTLTLWGGLSVQETLPHGTVEDVRDEVRRTIEICAPGGGFVLGTSNNVTQDTPLANFLAMYEAAEKYGTYPIKSR